VKELKTYYIQTFGCQMNYSDSERMHTYLQALGFKEVKSLKEADIVMFNTCSIKQKADDKAFGTLKPLKQKSRDGNVIIVLSGCMTRVSSSRYSEKRDPLFNQVNNLDIAIKTEDLYMLAGLLRELNPEIKIKDIEEEKLEEFFEIKATNDSFESGVQAFLPISNGCDKFCTYCIVPYSRGREKSRSMDVVLKEAEELVASGIKEIVLLGQTVNSYGLSAYDKKEKTFDFLGDTEPFPYLLEQLDKLYEKGLRRVRWTSPHPKDLSDKLIDTMATLRTQMPYIHLPIQSGSDACLKRMNRPETSGRYREIFTKLREKIPDISITTDYIVGFCGETEEEFMESYNFYEEIGFEQAFISQYSDRKGTVANKTMKDDVPKTIKHARWHRLNDLLKVHAKKSLERFVGRTLDVLIESKDGNLYTGKCPNYRTVQFESTNETLLGEILPVKITSSKEWVLRGELKK